MSEIAVRNAESAIVEAAESVRGDVDDSSERVLRDDARAIDNMRYDRGRRSCRPRRRSNGAALNTTGPPPSLAKLSCIPCDLTAALEDDASAF